MESHLVFSVFVFSSIPHFSICFSSLLLVSLLLWLFIIVATTQLVVSVTDKKKW